MMKLNELKKLGIKRERLDNGYRVASTYRYTCTHNPNLTIEMDKDYIFGDRVYLLSVNGELLENERKKTLKYDSVEDVELDIIDMLWGYAPTRYYTTCY